MAKRVHRLIADAVLVPLLVMAVLAAVLAYQVRVLLTDAAWVDHTDLVIAQANRAQKMLLEMELGARGYLLTADVKWLQPYEDARQNAQGAFDVLASLVREDPEDLARVESLRASYREWVDLARPSIENTLPGVPRDRDDATFVAGMRARKEVMDTMRATLLAMLDRQQELRVARAGTSRRANQATGLTAVIVLVLVGSLLLFITRRNLLAVRSRFEATIASERASRTVAEEALRMREEFLQMASHELKTPITSLLLQLESMERQLGRVDVPLDVDRLQKKAHSSLRQLRRLQELVLSLLDVERLTGTEAAIAMGDVDVVTVVQDALGQLGHELRESGCTVDVLAPEHLLVRADPVRLVHVMTNLLGNAIKYGRGRPIQIALAAQSSQATIRVQDQGIGISADDQARIFDRFERAVSGKHFHGFGLGLWIVRTLVEKMGGTIRVESREGSGATFIVELGLSDLSPVVMSSETIQVAPRVAEDAHSNAGPNERRAEPGEPAA